MLAAVEEEILVVCFQDDGLFVEEEDLSFEGGALSCDFETLAK